MPEFPGLPEGKISFTRIPGPFFSELLPQIDHLGELKVTLYALWQLDRMGGKVRYLLEQDFLEDETFIQGMAASPNETEAALSEALARAVQRGTFLRASVKLERELSLYFFNTPLGRSAYEAVQKGEWRPTGDARLPVELGPERPSIYRLYEQNIGPMTPVLADTLQDAEDTYPAEWIEEAFRIAVEKNVRNWRYVEAILRRWHERGYDGRETRRDTEKSRQQYADWESD
ncbi:MAG TPA: primosomal replication protein N [Chloroflexi bacterium]|nr:primosomal replication protein N [Chloroflexota bacterium]